MAGLPLLPCQCLLIRAEWAVLMRGHLNEVQGPTCLKEEQWQLLLAGRLVQAFCRTGFF